MSFLKCSSCPQTFASNQDAKDHFVETHASNRCQLCNRAASAKASPFCPTCKSAFLPELNLIEGLNADIRKVHKTLEALLDAKKRIENIVKARLVQERAKLFCAHNVPKSEPCPGCTAFENREVIKSQKQEKAKSERAAERAKNVIWVDV